MKRRLLNLLTVLSLVLCAAVVLWVRSYRVGTRITAAKAWLGKDSWRLAGMEADARGGAVTVSGIYGSSATQPNFDDTPAVRLMPGVYLEKALSPNHPFDDWFFGDGWRCRLFGFGIYSDRFSDSPPDWKDARFVGVATPGWFAALALAVLPAVRLFIAARTHRRLRLRLCPRCGYDLRAAPGRCPECGTASSGTA